MDVEATRDIRQAEVGASRTMLDRTEARFGIKPEWIAADTAYGNAENLGWLVKQRSIILFIPVIHCPAGHCAAMSREGINPSAPTAPGHDPTLNGMLRTTNTFAPRAMP